MLQQDQCGKCLRKNQKLHLHPVRAVYLCTACIKKLGRN